MVFPTISFRDLNNGTSAGKEKSAVCEKPVEKEANVLHKIWKTGTLTFANSTTLHGIRHLAAKIGITRKCLWLLLVLFCSSYMSAQIIERVLQYYRYPTTVNVKINFNRTLSFPALTICNQNAFRASAAADANVYHLIEGLYSHDNNKHDTDHTQLQDLTIDKLYTHTAHLKEDMIVECKWQDKECGPENFTEILTDHGVCYTFNNGNNEPLWVSSAGSDHGIKLTLNVEQYEYMPGPHNAAGIKLLLHDGKNFPKVANLGLAVPTGAHAFVGMQLVRVENLPKPHGTCQSESSPFYDTYSADVCQLTCFTHFMAEECSCRDMYLPHVDDYPPVCTIDQYVNCYRPKAAQVSRRVEDECNCPVPCDFLIYDPTISFSATSVYATEHLLATAAMETLKKKYFVARETTSRMNHFKFNTLLKLETDARSSFQELHNMMTSVGYSQVTAQKEMLQTVYDKMKATWDRKKYFLDWQAYHVEKNFIRPRQAMEERTLFSALLGFQELSYQIEIRIHQMAQPINNLTLNDDLRLNLYLETINMINGRIDLCDRAFDNYTQLYSAYYDGEPIFRYKFHSEWRKDNNFITPKKLLRDSLFRTSYTRKYSKRVGEDLRDVQHWLRRYLALANISYELGTVEKEDVYLANIMFLNRGRRFYQSRSEFYAESVEYPRRVLQSKIDNFERLWRSFDANYRKMFDSLDMILNNIIHLKRTILSGIKTGMDSTENYIRYGNISKLQAASELTADEIHVGINDLKNFFHEIRSRGQDIYDGWSTLLRSTNEIWDVVLNDENMKEFYEYRHLTEWLRPLGNVSEENQIDFNNYRDSYDYRNGIRNIDTRFFMTFQKLVEHMKDYEQRSRIDTKFIKENFLQLDVFYREKSYEQITQQPAYDIFALICDIGGAMGLFVGASVLTLYELVELILHVFLLPLVARVTKSVSKKKHLEAYAEKRPPSF